MDGTAFDRLARAVGSGSSRRRLLGALAGLGGILTALEAHDTAAENPRDRLRRRKAQRRRKQRNRQQQNSNSSSNNNGNNGNNKKKNNTNKGGGLGGSQCAATGGNCTLDSDCCNGNCFNFQCAEYVHQCSAGGSTNPCRPPAKGCAGDQCCHGALACNDGCCEGAANQCNSAGICCAPNCSGKQCGPDGCNAGGTCGMCTNGLTCDGATGQCQSTCGSCTNGFCLDGACQPCDVCPTCRFTTIRAAIDESSAPIIFICPGTYTEGLRVGRNVLLFGAGQGNGPSDTIVSPPDQDAGVSIAEGVGSVELRQLRVTGSTFRGIDHAGMQLSMTDCTVTGNSGDQNFAAGIFTFGALTMENCTISENRLVGSSGAARGGGIAVDNAEVTLKNCLVTENSAISTDPNATLGGGIYLAASAALTLSNTHVTSNFTNGLGGGLYLDDNSSATLEDGSAVTLNDPTNCAGNPVAGCIG